MTNFSVTRFGEKCDESWYSWDEETKTFHTKENLLVIDFGGSCHLDITAGNNCTIITGGDCSVKTGDFCKINSESCCLFSTGYGCVFHVNDYCRFKTKSNCVFVVRDGCLFDVEAGCVIVSGSYVIRPNPEKITFITGLGFPGISERERNKDEKR